MSPETASKPMTRAEVEQGIDELLVKRQELQARIDSFPEREKEAIKARQR